MAKLDRRAALTVPCSALLASVALVVGLSTCAHVISTRRAVDVIHAHRVLELAAHSALEEAAARMENALAPVPYPPAGQLREPGLETLRYPSNVSVPIAASDAAAEHVRLTDVHVRWSGFRRSEHPGPRGVQEREYGVVELAVTATLSTRGGPLARRLRVRRFVNLEPSAADQALRFRIHPGNLTCEIEEAR